MIVQRRALLIVLSGALVFGGRVHAGETPLTVVTLGDSITRGIRPGVKPEETFTAYLQVELGKQGIKAMAVNVGIGGERTDQALKRFAKDVAARKPAVVTIMYGHNDCHVDKGKKESRLPIGEFRANLKRLVSEARKEGIRPILMTPPCYARSAGPDGAGDHPNVKLGQYAEACRAVAKEMDVPLVDHFAHWSRALADGVDLKEWTTDLYHPNPRGHRIMAERMTSVVVEVLRKK